MFGKSPKTLLSACLYNKNITLSSILFFALEHKIHIFSPTCNTLYISYPRMSQLCRSALTLIGQKPDQAKYLMTTFTAKGTHKTLATALHVLQNMYDFVISCSVILQRTAKKCTKTHNARAESLFCSLTLLFSDFLVAVVVVVYQKSLI